jgi:hypothetical protein
MLGRKYPIEANYGYVAEPNCVVHGHGGRRKGRLAGRKGAASLSNEGVCSGAHSACMLRGTLRRMVYIAAVGSRVDRTGGDWRGGSDLAICAGKHLHVNIRQLRLKQYTQLHLRTALATHSACIWQSIVYEMYLRGCITVMRRARFFWCINKYLAEGYMLYSLYRAQLCRAAAAVLTATRNMWLSRARTMVRNIVSR